MSQDGLFWGSGTEQLKLSIKSCHDRPVGKHARPSNLLSSCLFSLNQNAWCLAIGFLIDMQCILGKDDVNRLANGLTLILQHKYGTAFGNIGLSRWTILNSGEFG